MCKLGLQHHWAKPHSNSQIYMVYWNSYFFLIHTLCSKYSLRTRCLRQLRFAVWLWALHTLYSKYSLSSSSTSSSFSSSSAAPPLPPPPFPLLPPLLVLGIA